MMFYCRKPVLVLLLTLFVCHQCLRAYDSPDFDYEIIDTDALLLEPNDRETLVELLNAVVCNFPDSSLIDEDLREKAIALAMSLDPLNANSRNAHLAMSAGRPPVKTAYFQSSVSEVSERLWEEAAKMSGKKGEPEGRKLALFLEELSLILHPEPPVARIRSYSAKSEGNSQAWQKFVELQPEENPSNGKLKELFKEMKAGRKAPDKKPAALPGPRPKATVKVEDPVPTPAPSPVTESLKLSEVEIPCVVQITADGETGNIGGITKISAEIEPDEKSLRVKADSEGFDITGFRYALPLARNDQGKYPDGTRAQIGFTSEQPIKSTPADTKADVSVTTALLLNSIVTGEKPVPGLVVAGFSSGGATEFSVGEDVADVIQKAKDMKAEFLLVPDSQYDAYLKTAVETGQLELFFDPQLISWSSWEQLKNTVFGRDSSDLIAASTEFKRIQAVQDQMPLVDLARNDKVKERLQKIAEAYPQHLSARVMLDFGSAPMAGAAVTKQGLITRIDDALQPFLPQIVEALDDETPEQLDFAAMKPVLEESDQIISGIQRDIQPDVRNYLYQAKTLINAVTALINSSRADSDQALQRFEAVDEAFTGLQLERTALGLEKIGN